MIRSFLVPAALVSIVVVLAVAAALLVLAVAASLLWVPVVGAYYLHQIFLGQGWWSNAVLLWALLLVVMLGVERLVVRPHR